MQTDSLLLEQLKSVTLSYFYATFNISAFSKLNTSSEGFCDSWFGIHM
jgi:hypothetical protein